MFNVPTGLAIWCSEALTLALILLMVWRHDRKTSAYLAWCVGFALSGIGFGLVAARGMIPNLLSIEIANAIALLGQSGWILGFLLLSGRKFAWWTLLPVAIWLAGVFLPWINDSYPNRVALYNLASTAGASALAFAALPITGRPGKTRLQLATIFSIQACVCFTAALAIAVTQPSVRDAVNYGAAAALASAFLLILAFALSSRLIMERSERHLRALIVTDPLTGILNRRGLFDYFGHVRARARQSEGQVAALLFDLDHFKRINDLHGHQVGDAVLVEFARIVAQFMPKGGSFGRLGGEEFAAFVVIRDQVEAEAIAELVRTEFTRLPTKAGAVLVPATVSVGVAIAPADGADCDRLVSAADRALYAAKAAGRNCTIVFGEAEAAASVPSPDPTGGDLVPTLEDQIHALRRIGNLSRM
ncbi:GGDEF domain-containing protein [Rhizobium sp. BK251]|uniref:GGDEF domain-containing protein n=1 Tax=Rhizobium sp. BK251 TaxID=2512125 RepID=UPI00104AE87F|nr:GGDEF domain-containing protein [Rhizobium sp. BK251]TCL70373.1 diguanylate cyclase (GGDEF)-like protein [Rhizobium sp. BK251]